MPEVVDIALSDLLIDTRNARLTDGVMTQQAALLAMARHEGPRLMNLAADIVEHGMDPTSLRAVVPTDDQKKRYTVLEGNRRIVALKGLETPGLLLPALDSANRKKLTKLSHRFSANPISTVKCVLFESEQDAIHWINLRHTGQNEGIGLVQWGADEKDRFSARYGQRSPEGQILDFVGRHDLLSDAAKQSKKGIITTVRRLISNPTVREKLGIALTDQGVASWYPASEVAKGLSRVVDDLRTERVKVGALYHAEQREQYAEHLPAHSLPDPSTRLDAPRLLADLDSPDAKPAEAKSQQTKKPRKKAEAIRTALIPKTCQLNISHPRINAIYIELLTMSVDQYTNACSVLLRVFVELSVDHYLEQEAGMTEDQRWFNLAWKLQEAASHLMSKGKITAALEQAVKKVAQQDFTLAATIPNFHRYVHNEYVYPKPTELRTAWDEIQPFIEKLFAA